MSDSASPTMIVAARSGQRVAMEVHNAARVFGPDSNTEYHVVPAVGKLCGNGGGNVARRTLTRTHRLIDRMKTWGALPPSAYLGASILRDKKSGVYFPEVRWQSERGVDVRHWLRLGRPLSELDAPPNTIRFVTGTCLFGRSAVAHLADGSQRPLVSTRQMLPAPIKRLTIDEDLSLYELDTACRLGSVIGDMAGQCALASHVFLHIPRPEYVLVMMGHQRGVCSGEIMKDWLDAVELRGSRVGRLFKALLARRSARSVHAGSPLDEALMPYLRDAVKHGRTPSPHELAEVIRHSSGNVGELFERWLGACKSDEDLDYYGLAQFGYVAGVAGNLADGALTIEVDNPSEEPIFKAVSRVVRRAGKLARLSGNAMAVYPYEQMASWTEGAPDWRRVTRTAVDGDVVGAIMAQYGIDMHQRDDVWEL